MAAIIKGPEARIRRNDALIAFGSGSPPSGGGAVAAFISLGASSTGLATGAGLVSENEGLASFSGFFAADLVENSTLNGFDEDDAAAWLLKSAPH
jgi:hypothetical protein